MTRDDLAKIPFKFRDLFEMVSNHLRTISVAWAQFRELFDESEPRARLLYDTGAHFFATVRTALVDSVVMGACRLSDPPKSMGRRNVSFPALIDAVSDAGLVNLSIDLSMLMATADQKIERLRTPRNRLLAHLDFDSLEGTAARIDRPEYEAIEDSLAALREIVYRIQREYLGRERRYRGAIVIGGVDDLIFVLEAGLRALAEER